MTGDGDKLIGRPVPEGFPTYADKPVDGTWVGMQNKSYGERGLSKK